MNVPELDLADLEKMPPKEILLLDMRGERAYENGHLPNAQLFDPKCLSEEGSEALPPDKTLILYCTFGEKSVHAAVRLRDLGFQAYSLRGGYGAWVRRDARDMARYERQIILPEVGLDGQRRLFSSSVLIVGAGGLGCPAAQYLAGAGIGKIGLIDADAASLNNLHRQILHTMKGIGRNKAESAADALRQLNDQVDVVPYPVYLTPENVNELIREYDFIIDAVDNFETKFLINDACVTMGKAFCHAGVVGYEGQVLTYVPGQGPCIRCIFGEIPDRADVPSCSQVGVLGPLAGIIGCIQATEAIKYLLGIGTLLTGKMFIFNGLTMQSRIARFPNPSEDCRVCGARPDITDVRANAAQYRPRSFCRA